MAGDGQDEYCDKVRVHDNHNGEGEDEDEDEDRIVVTGFGPFGIFLVNPSWQSVAALNVDRLNKRYKVKVIRQEVPVVYSQVDQLVKELWQIHKPKLMIHVGVSPIAQKLTLERCAHNEEYKREDCWGKCPPGGVHGYGAGGRCQKPQKLATGLDVQDICHRHNLGRPPIEACPSDDAGRYLCEYTYFASLTIDPRRTLFIHVPSIHDGNTVQTISQGLESIIGQCLQQLDR